jgi:predicted lipoprotein with Yx(FWY)xxD motif
MRRRVFGIMVVFGMAVTTIVAIAPAGAASKPGQPGKPTAVAKDKAARVSWSAPTNGGSPITIYLVTPYLGSKAQKTQAFHSKVTSQLITGLSNGRSYTFRVAAHNALGTGKQSVASNAVTVGGGTPGAPTILSVAAGNGQATVSWHAPAAGLDPISSYIVTPYAGAQAQPAQPFLSNATTEVVTGLTNSRSYSFRVAAHNAAGTGPQSPTSNSVEPTSSPSLSVAMNTTLGKQIIVNAYGQTLYLYTPDGSSTTTKASPGLLSVWPAVTWSGTATVGAGLDQSKVAVDVQADGTRQLAYNGHLLYTFIYDPSPGDVSGEASGGFYVLSPSGDAT